MLAIDLQRPEQPQINQKLADEPIQSRQAADRERSDQKAQRRARHSPSQTAEPVDLARFHGMNDRAGTQEQQPLEQRVIPDVQQGPAQTQDDPLRAAQRSSDQRQSNADQNNADVLDAAVGQQTFEIALADREGDAQHTG